MVILATLLFLHGASLVGKFSESTLYNLQGGSNMTGTDFFFVTMDWACGSYGGGEGGV